MAAHDAVRRATSRASAGNACASVAGAASAFDLPDAGCRMPDAGCRMRVRVRRAGRVADARDAPVRERGAEDIEDGVDVLDGRAGVRDRHVGPLETGLRRGYRGSQGP
ncbi:hypothetical protein [Burkholderia cepacia]|uniref:hypothetical protein n=1 Tax=Burkholderia cepacia TaxID=292 RepID=UPI001CF2794E|nr:hypothetical protein [Burkholderia cepacia]MCA8323215.1 hypothetical protein [Burkholderia cepacia]